jgi:hypothetical protein
MVGSWQGPTTILAGATLGISTRTMIDLDTDSTGNVHAVFIAHTGSPATNKAYYTFKDSGGWHTPELLVSDSNSVENIRVAVKPDNNLVVMWTVGGTSNTTGFKTRSGGVWTAAPAAYSGHGMGLDVGPDGTIWAALSASASGTDLNRWTGSAWVSVGQILNSSQISSYGATFDLAVAPDGKVHVISAYSRYSSQMIDDIWDPAAGSWSISTIGTWSTTTYFPMNDQSRIKLDSNGLPVALGFTGFNGGYSLIHHVYRRESSGSWTQLNNTSGYMYLYDHDVDGGPEGSALYSAKPNSSSSQEVTFYYPGSANQVLPVPSSTDLTGAQTVFVANGVYLVAGKGHNIVSYFLPILFGPDADGDGMPNVYELVHYCLNVSVADGILDPDGDGMNNLYEYQHTTDPCSPPQPMFGTLQGPATIACGRNIDPAQQPQAPVLDAGIDGNGVIHLAWIELVGSDYKLYYAQRGSGAWSAPEEIFTSTTAYSNLRMHIDGSNQVHLMWVSASSTTFLTKTSGGWTQVESPVAAYCCDMDVTAAGQTYAICPSGVNYWDGAAWQLMAGSYAGCGAVLAGGFGGERFLPGLALGPNGHIHVAHNSTGTTTACNTYHREYTPGSGWTTETVLTATCTYSASYFNQARVRVDAEGQPVIFSYQEKTSASQAVNKTALFRRVAGNTWTQPRTTTDFAPASTANVEGLFFTDFSAGPFDWLALSRNDQTNHGQTDLFFPEGVTTFSASPWDIRYLNKPLLTGDGLHRIVASWDATCLYEYYLPFLRDDDQDQMPDAWESGLACLNPHANDAGLDPDGDGLTNLQEYAAGTDPCGWDSDADALPDGYELAHGLDPLVAADGSADADGDGISNTNEYYNGSDPGNADPAPGKFENPGCYYWADGDGDGNPAPSDFIMLKLEVAGVAQDYRDILPHGTDTLDLDRDGHAAPSDEVLLKLMIAGSEQPGGYPSQALSLEEVDAPSGSVAEGSTTHVTLSVHSVSGDVPYAPGYGVVFTVDSGNAMLLGGDGTADGEPAGNRYDISMEAAAGAQANIVVLITGPGPITIGARIPACGMAPYGRWNDEVVLGPPVVINQD